MQKQLAQTVTLPAQVRSLFESALNEHGADAPAVWLRYAACHLARGEIKAASAVHERALKVLGQAHHASFIEAYQAHVRDS